MHKKAKTRFPIHKLLQTRWSPRAYAATPIAKDVLGSLFEAARWAPSAFNKQPWTFIVARRENTPAFEQMLGCLSERNQQWACNASALILTMKLHQPEAGANAWAAYDLGGAVTQLTLQANDFGFAVHQMAGFDPQLAIQRFNIPEDWLPMTVLAIGRVGDISTLPEDLQNREKADRIRKPLEKMVFENAWGQSADFVATGRPIKRNELAYHPELSA